MNTAPWKDFNGTEIHEGDVIEHPDGERGTVVCLRRYDDEADRWRVTYGTPDGYSRLCLQIGDKGQAVVVCRHDGEHGRSVDAPPGGSPQGSRTGTALTVARARQIDVVAALSALRSIVQFAYRQGYHELGYDPVQELENALQSAQRRSGNP